MVLESILFIFIVSMVKRYNFVNAQDFPKRGVIFPFIFVILQLFSIAMIKKGMSLYTYRTLNLVGFSMFFLYFGLNYKYKGIITMALGIVLNLIPMIFNKGTMPVNPYFYSLISTEEDYRATFMGYNLLHTLIDSDTKFAFLGDVIPLLPPYPFPKIISIGDVLLGVGFSILSITTLRGDYMTSREEVKEEIDDDVKIFPRYNLKSEENKDMEDTKHHNLEEI